MNSRTRRFGAAALLLCVSFTAGIAQVETVPVHHPVYLFLKRMEVKTLIGRYHDAILPIGRREVAGFLREVEERRAELSTVEQGWLDDFLSEFAFEVRGHAGGFHSLISTSEPFTSEGFGQITAPREKFLYALTDSAVTFFVNGLLTFDGRFIDGDALGGENAQYVQFGGRIRGTLFGKFGYLLQGTNAQFRGSRDLLRRDRVISQSFALNTLNAHNFDFTEGYARFDAEIVSAQVGRERLLWGTGYDQKMILSENVRVFDFIRADAQYKALKYTFVHAWILGKRNYLTFTLPSDPTAVFIEPVVADKYFAAHRLEFSFPSLFDIGGQEMVIYSNRSPDLAYLNPFAVIESAQRSREERDNVMWAFDLQTRFLRGLEFHGTLFLDDLNLPDLGKDVWTNRFAYQAGLFYADPLGLSNTSVMIEYTRVEPWVFSHSRSRENDYGSLGAILGPRIGPNADSWFVRTDWLPARDLVLSLRVSFVRQGKNVVDANGRLIRNVGADILQPHRDTDPERKVFLDGILVRTRRVEFAGTIELVNQIWLDGLYELESIRNEDTGVRDQNHTIIGRLRLEL